MADVKVEHKHAKHKTWLTKVTVDDKRTFGLKKLNDGSYRVYTPFLGKNHNDFKTVEEALKFCES